MKADNELKSVLLGVFIALSVAAGLSVFPGDISFQAFLKIIIAVAVIGIGLLVIQLYQNASRLSGITIYSSKLI